MKHTITKKYLHDFYTNYQAEPVFNEKKAFWVSLFMVVYMLLALIFG